MCKETESLGERLKLVIEGTGLTKGEFAKKAEISQSLISNILSGKNGPSHATINLLCRTYNINKTWLRTGEGKMLNENSAPIVPETESPTTGPDGEPLKDEEAELIGLYRKLEEPAKDKVLTYARDMQSVQENKLPGLEKGDKRADTSKTPQ